jgi:hypothetical protein
MAGRNSELNQFLGRNKMKKLAISVLTMAVTCCGVYGMEIQEHLKPNQTNIQHIPNFIQRNFGQMLKWFQSV